MIRRAALTFAAIAAVALAAAPAASAHAVLEATSPGRGAQLDRAPKQVVFRFGEAVEAAFGAVRVYDGRGDRVDSGGTKHPNGRADAVAVALRHGLGDGTYTATYRVISADSHPVSGGFVFTVGQGGTPAETLDQLLQSAGAGRVTEVGFGVVRALSYLALALAAGGVAFVALVWRPALAAVGGSDESWGAAGEAFAARARAHPARRRRPRACSSPLSGWSSRARSRAAPPSGGRSTRRWSATCFTPASGRSGG